MWLASVQTLSLMTLTGTAMALRRLRQVLVAIRASLRVPILRGVAVSSRPVQQCVTFV